MKIQAVRLVLCVLGLLLSVNMQAAQGQPGVTVEGPYTIVSRAMGDEDFMLMVSLRKPTYSEVVSYAGKCTANLRVDLIMPEPEAKKAFEASGKFDDLNAAQIMDVFTRQLGERCPNAATVEVVLGRIDQPLVARLSKAARWKNTLENLGADAAADPANKILAEATRKIASAVTFVANDPFTGVQTRGLVECKGESTIGMHGPAAFPAARGRRFTEYRQFARLAAPEFKKLCPVVEVIKFRPSPNPAGFTCVSDCYLQANLVSDDWRIVPIGYERHSGREAIASFDDMLNLMKAGDFDLIRSSYTGYYKHFHNQFLLSYSQKCAGRINDPVSFEVVTIEETIDSNGFNVGSRQLGEPYTVTIDRRYRESFLKYRDANQLRLLDRVMEAELQARQTQPHAIGGEGVKLVVGEAAEESARVNQFVNERCDHPDVLSVYNRLSDVLPLASNGNG